MASLQFHRLDSCTGICTMRVILVVVGVVLLACAQAEHSCDQDAIQEYIDEQLHAYNSRALQCPQSADPQRRQRHATAVVFEFCGGEVPDLPWTHDVKVVDACTDESILPYTGVSAFDTEGGEPEWACKSGGTCNAGVFVACLINATDHVTGFRWAHQGCQDFKPMMYVDVNILDPEDPDYIYGDDASNFWIVA